LDEPDFWYPAGSIHTRAWRDNADLAKWICRERCYVRQQCLAEMCRGGIHLMRGADRRLAGAA
ncbi:hypothetical protein KBZ21_41845, partial [Streptomyces sp. A73]|nr:hypothetical protein [Streptomyces sp. A73]